MNERYSDETPSADPLRLTITEPARSADTLSGVIECGVLAVGDEILISPSNRAAAVVALADAVSGTAVDRARAGMRVTVSLDRAAQAEAGELVSHHATPPLESDVFRVRLTWSGAAPLIVPAGLSLRLASSVTPEPVTVERIERIVEPSQADDPGADPGKVPRSALADVIVRAGRVLAFDQAESGLATGRVTLLDGATVVGAGAIDMVGYADQRALITRRATNVSKVEYRIDRAMRSARNGHAGGVLWLTGLSGAGKTTLAVELERDLFERGYQTYILDGDNLRHGLNANLGFSPEDRAENIRRVGAVAALFAEAGFIVISAFISPYRSDRERARLATTDGFHEIYVKAELATCERRDTKGLYKKARAGEIADFTGISAPYEAPEACELVIDTDRLSIAQSIERISSYARREFPFTHS